LRRDKKVGNYPWVFSITLQRVNVTQPKGTRHLPLTIPLSKAWAKTEKLKGVRKNGISGRKGPILSTKGETARNGC